MNTYQAILTKFLPPTDHRGARIKAWCTAGNVTIGYPYELSGVECHADAVHQLCLKLDAECAAHGDPTYRWTAKKWVAGGLPVKFSGADYAFVDAHTA